MIFIHVIYYSAPGKSPEKNSSTTAVRRVELKFYVDVERLEFPIDIDLHDGVNSNATITDQVLWAYLEQKAKALRNVITIELFDRVAEEELRVDMSDMDA